MTDGLMIAVYPQTKAQKLYLDQRDAFVKFDVQPKKDGVKPVRQSSQNNEPKA
jgi:hypothetical protein